MKKKPKPEQTPRRNSDRLNAGTAIHSASSGRGAWSMCSRIAFAVTTSVVLLSPARGLGGGQSKVYLVSTVHDLHKSKSFTEGQFTALLQKIAPDKILLEFPTDWFDSVGIPVASTKVFLEDETNKDGRRDSQLAWKYCSQKKIPCQPFDIAKRNEFFKINNVFQRLEDFENDLREFAKKRPALNSAFSGVQSLYESCLDQPPAVLNSSLCDSAIRMKEDFFLKLYEEAKSETKLRDPDFYKLQNDFWKKRNEVMASNICQAAMTGQNTRIAVITGADHHYLLGELLAKCDQANLIPWQSKSKF